MLQLKACANGQLDSQKSAKANCTGAILAVQERVKNMAFHLRSLTLFCKLTGCVWREQCEVGVVFVWNNNERSCDRYCWSCMCFQHLGGTIMNRTQVCMYVAMSAALYLGKRFEIVLLSGIIRIHTVTPQVWNLFLVANK